MLGAKIPVTSAPGGESLPKLAIGASAVGSGVQHQIGLNSAGQAPVPVQGYITEPQQGAVLGKQISGMQSIPGMQGSMALFKETADALGFPKDNLSIALIAFTRFFSLSPNPVFIGTLRRELLSLSKTFSQEAAGQRAGQEAETMAAVIAADKGVILSRETLERYATYLLPPDSVDSEESSPDWNENENFTAEEIRKQAEEQAKKDELLGLLNSLPGKNGQYWKVFPFVIKVKGVELRIFVRILQQEEALSSNGSEYLIADISSPKRQWRYLLKKDGVKRSANIRVYPEYHPKALDLLKKKAEQFFEGFDEILVQNGDKIPSWVEDLFSQPLPSIDEKV